MGSISGSLLFRQRIHRYKLSLHGRWVIRGTSNNKLFGSMCLLVLNYSYNMAYNSDNTANMEEMTFNRDVSPVWAQLLHKGVQNRAGIKNTLSQVGDNPALIPGAIFGKTFLDRVIDPTLTKLLPDSVRADVLKNKINFSPNRNLNMGFKLDKKNPLLTLDWRF